MSDAPGIDGFEHIKLIGSGGFADVHLYRQRMPNRTVAVKILRSGELSDAVKRQFIVEANVMARLSNHPGIATIYTAGITAGDRPYLVMEFCPGGSLAERYRSAPLPVAEAVSIGVKMAAALESAHRVGVVHRDVKPANILVTEYGSPVLTDFGIALGHDAALESTMLNNMSTQGSTRDGAGLAYSVPWAAPEVLLESDENDAIADVYSLAATVRTLIEGVSPFEIVGGNNSLLAMSRRVERGESVPWVGDGVPDRLREVIDRAMSVRRGARYQTALEFAYALQSVEVAEGLRSTGVELLSSAADAGQPPVPVEPESPVDDLERTVMRGRPLSPGGTDTSAEAPEAAEVMQPAFSARLVTADLDAGTDRHGEPADTGVEDAGHTTDDAVAASEETQLRTTVDRETSTPIISTTRSGRRRKVVVGAVALASAIAVAAIALPPILAANPTGTPRCENLSDTEKESAVPLTLTQDRLDQLVPDGIDVLCGFSQPWEGQEYPAASGQYHLVVLGGSGTEFVEVARAISAIAIDLGCEAGSDQNYVSENRGNYGPEIRETWFCEDFIDGELNSASVYHLGKAPPQSFSFVPEGVPSSIVVALRLPNDFEGWT